jgi:hypothetical protein
MRTAPKSKNSKSQVQRDFTGDKPEIGAADPGKTRRKAVVASSAFKEVTNQEKHQLIAEAAYFRAERRNFIPGYELEDWLIAEAEIEMKLPDRDMNSRSRKA